MFFSQAALQKSLEYACGAEPRGSRFKARRRSGPVGAGCQAQSSSALPGGIGNAAARAARLIGDADSVDGAAGALTAPDVASSVSRQSNWKQRPPRPQQIGVLRSVSGSNDYELRYKPPPQVASGLASGLASSHKMERPLKQPAAPASQQQQQAQVPAATASPLLEGSAAAELAPRFKTRDLSYADDGIR